MALAVQALEAQKGRKPLEQGGALEQVAARIKRVMGLTFEFTGAARLHRAASGGMMGWALRALQRLLLLHPYSGGRKCGDPLVIFSDLKLVCFAFLSRSYKCLCEAMFS